MALGTSSRSSASGLATTSRVKKLMLVVLLPRRGKLATSPTARESTIRVQIRKHLAQARAKLPVAT
jgi:hypothetical protein